MADVHIGSKGVQVTHPAGYMNRAARRAYMKKHGGFKKHSFNH